jgi:diaminopimelate epimerase
VVSLHFTKMHGLGNDFVVLDARAAVPSLDVSCIRALADRHTGVGFDQLLIVENPGDAACVAAYSIRNADGSPAQQCGNGARCIGAWLHRAGVLAIGATSVLESPAGRIGVRLIDASMVAVEMGEPDFEPAHLPFDAEFAAESYPLNVEGGQVTIAAVSIGNPHAVVEVRDVNVARVEQLGPLITAHPRFPEGVNAGFAQVVDARTVRLRVHERGVGWTQACGSGACAAVAVLHRRGRVGSDVHVELPGGVLRIEWPGPGHALWMTGPAVFSFDGEWLGAGVSG